MTKLKQQIEQKEKELAELKAKLQEKESRNNFVKIKLSTGIIEVERKLNLEMESYKKIKIPQGLRLLTLPEFLEIWNEHREDLDFGGEHPDEFIKQPIKENEKEYPYWNVWFRSLDGGSGLGGDGGASGYRARGVRFARDLK